MSPAIFALLCVVAYLVTGTVSLRLVLPRFWADSLRQWRNSERYARESVMWKVWGWVLGWPVYAVAAFMYRVIIERLIFRVVDQHNPYRRERELQERERRLRELERRNRELERELEELDHVSDA